MSKENYKTQELIKPTFFNKHLKENFLIELENLLNKNESNLLAITNNQISELKKKYKIKDTEFKEERENLFDVYLNQCLNDEVLTNKEKEELAHLENLLNISEEYVKARIKKETEIIYRRKVQAVISDAKIDDTEKKELEAMQTNLNIDDSVESNIRGEEIKNKIQSFVDSLIEKRRVSPDDEIKLNQLAKDMDVKLTFEDNGLEKLKLFWEIENKELPSIPCDINIQKSESLYYKTNIRWYEERSRTTYSNYGGVSTRIKICKGVYLHGGSIAPSRHTEEYMKLIDSGEVYITNKRIIFMGNHGNKTINLTKVLSYTAYNNGIQIDKDTGKSPFFECDDPELLGMYLSRVLADL